MLPRIFIFISICISCVLCKKKLCDFDDNQCLTASAERTFVQFVSGMPGVEPSDPISVESLEGNLPTLKYRLIDGSLSGMKNCQVELVQISVTDKKYTYHIGCPHVNIESKYEVKGKIGPEFVEGNGTCKVDYYDYNFLFNGDYERRDCKDGKSYIHLTNFNLELESKGKVNFEFKNLFNGDKKKSYAAHKFANENWQFLDKLVRQPIMDAFMKKYINNVNDYLKQVSIQDLFYQE